MQDMPLMQAVNKAAYFLLDSDVNSFEENLFQAMGAMAVAVDVDRVYIWENHLIDGVLHCTQVYEWSENAMPQQNNELTVNIPYSDVAPDWEAVLSRNKAINSLVCNMIAETREHLEAQGVKSILTLPVFLEGEFWGFVGFDDCRNERLFTEAEEMILRSASLLFAHGYRKNKIMREIDERNEYIRAMFESAPIGLTIFDDKLKPVDCNDAVLKIHGGIARERYLEHFFELSPEYQPDGMKSKDKALDILRHAINGEQIQTEWTHCRRTGALVPCEVTLVGAKTGGKDIVMAYAYDLRHIKKLEADLYEAKNLANHDALTGLYNRRYLDETLERILHILSRSTAQLSLLMLDIDYFKLYNDTYGHHEGDNCLKAIADILSKTLVREEDFVARFGGEEFVVVLPNTDGRGACIVAEKIISSIRDAKISHESSSISDYVTVSIGAINTNVYYERIKDDYLVMADEMLYASKQAGRDRYTFRRMG